MYLVLTQLQQDNITCTLMFVKISIISENKAKSWNHLRDMLMDFSAVAILFHIFLTC